MNESEGSKFKRTTVLGRDLKTKITIDYRLHISDGISSVKIKSTKVNDKCKGGDERVGIRCFGT